MQTCLRICIMTVIVMKWGTDCMSACCVQMQHWVCKYTCRGRLVSSSAAAMPSHCSILATCGDDMMSTKHSMQLEVACLPSVQCVRVTDILACACVDAFVLLMCGCVPWSVHESWSIRIITLGKKISSWTLYSHFTTTKQWPSKSMCIVYSALGTTSGTSKINETTPPSGW